MDYIEALCNKCGRLLGVPKNLVNHECGGRLIPLGLEHDDYITLCHIWSKGNEIDYTVHWDLYNAMVELKQKDIIEYNLKMSQFRTQVGQQEVSRAQNDTTPKCPHCSSTNIKPISGLGRGASIAMWGIFSKKINKSFECKNCGYTW